jgi:hypothetical protein
MPTFVPLPLAHPVAAEDVDMSTVVPSGGPPQ